MTEIIDETYKMIDELKKQPKYKKLKELNIKLENKYGNLIKNYYSAKLKYDEITKEGSHYHPDFKEAAKNLSHHKEVLFEKPEVKEILKLEKEIELELNSLIREFTEVISKNIKTPNELGLISNIKGGSHGSLKKTIHR